jgi:hypothetical protein
VISLSGVILVYDQDLERGDAEEMSPLSDPGSTAQPTATMEKITVDIEAVGNESPKDGDADAEDGTMP